MSAPLGTAAHASLITAAIVGGSRETSPLESLFGSSTALSAAARLAQTALSPTASYFPSSNISSSLAESRGSPVATQNPYLFQYRNALPSDTTGSSHRSIITIAPGSPMYRDVHSPNSVDFAESPRAFNGSSQSGSVGPEEASISSTKVRDSTPVTDRPDEESATQIWRMYNRAKERLSQSSRVENLAWRIMSLSLKRKQIDEEEHSLTKDDLLLCSSSSSSSVSRLGSTTTMSNQNNDKKFINDKVFTRGLSAPADDIQIKDTLNRSPVYMSNTVPTPTGCGSVPPIMERSQSLMDIRYPSATTTIKAQQSTGRNIRKPVKPSLKLSRPNMARASTTSNATPRLLERTGSSITIPADDSYSATVSPLFPYATPTALNTAMVSSPSVPSSLLSSSTITSSGLDSAALLSSTNMLANFPFTFNVPLDSNSRRPQQLQSLSNDFTTTAATSSNHLSALIGSDVTLSAISAANTLFGLTSTTTAMNGIINDNNTVLGSPHVTSAFTATTSPTCTIGGVGRGGGSGDGGGGDDVGGKLLSIGGIRGMPDYVYTMAATTSNASDKMSSNDRRLVDAPRTDSIDSGLQSKLKNSDTSTVDATTNGSDDLPNGDDPSVIISCQNCETTVTPLWRRDPEGRPLCNACGLFLKLHGVLRPKSLKTNVIKKRNRRPRPTPVAHRSFIRPAPPNYNSDNNNLNYIHTSHQSTLSLNMPEAKRARPNDEASDGPGNRLTTHPLENTSQPRQAIAMAIAERLHNQRVLAAARLAAERMAHAEDRHGNYYVGHALAPTDEAMENDVTTGFWFHSMPQYYNSGYDEFDLSNDETFDVEMQ